MTAAANRLAGLALELLERSGVDVELASPAGGWSRIPLYRGGHGTAPS